MKKSSSDNRFHLKGGVLIIGSLLWQDYLNNVDDNIRKKWRAEHLLADDKIMVSVPIRYGRFSTKNEIYTMTFCKKLSKKNFGTGYLVPFRKTFIMTKSDLLHEATALSNAEGMKGSFVASWGTIGILFNDKKINSQIKLELTDFWKSKIAENNNFNNLNYKISEKEKPCINANGLLNFDWIKPVDRRQAELLNSYDFVLATATMPTDYPTSPKLSKYVQSDKSRYYFVENYKSGITTYQDLTVINSL